MANQKNHSAAIAAITAHFCSTYISGNGRLAAYQQLCRDLDVDVGSSIIQCKRVEFISNAEGPTSQLTKRSSQNIKGARVNIHDFVRVQQNGGDINAYKFRSYSALRGEILNNPGRRFPLRKAKTSEFLSVMLVNL
ncbi:hypothetical protein Q7P35_007225 [Cladosporium inversicolor]